MNIFLKELKKLTKQVCKLRRATVMNAKKIFSIEANFTIPIGELIYRGDEMSGDVFFVP
jgi:hypothetical protein